jgi:hypothetical protein
MTRVLYTEIKTGERLVATDITNLTFFPKGTILTFSSEAWNAASAAFKTIWKICNGDNGTPNLVGKFLRGGSSSGASGGADNQTVTLNLTNMPRHKHTDSGHTHSAYGGHNSTNHDNAIYTSAADYWGSGVHTGYANISYEGGLANGAEGSAAPFTIDTVPMFYTVIYIMKVA